MDYGQNIAHSTPSEGDLAIDASVISNQSPLSQQSFSEPLPYVCNSSALLAEPSEGTSESHATFAPLYTIDDLFSRELLRFILNDYVTCLPVGSSDPQTIL